MIFCLALFAPALRAESTEPEIYFFWSASCPYSKAARTFLAAAQIKNSHLRIRDFEVDESAANMRLLGRLYEKIGMPAFWVVPVVVARFAARLTVAALLATLGYRLRELLRKHRAHIAQRDSVAWPSVP